MFKKETPLCENENQEISESTRDFFCYFNESRERVLQSIIVNGN